MVPKISGNGAGSGPSGDGTCGQRITRTEQIPIAIHAVDAADGWPEFVLSGPWRWEGGELARIRTIPGVVYDRGRCVGLLLEGIVRLIELTLRDLSNFLSDHLERGDKSIELSL